MEPETMLELVWWFIFCIVAGTFAHKMGVI